MDAEKAILTRRSTRRFLYKPIEKQIIDKIVEAGRYAPSGGNNQTNHFFAFFPTKRTGFKPILLNIISFY